MAHHEPVRHAARAARHRVRHVIQRHTATVTAARQTTIAYRHVTIAGWPALRRDDRTTVDTARGSE